MKFSSHRKDRSYYFHAILFILIIFIAIMIPFINQQITIDRSFSFSFFPVLLSGLIGILLGLDSLLLQRMANGKWRFRTRGIPMLLVTLILSMYPWLYYSGAVASLPIGQIHGYILESRMIFLILLGYFIIRCFEKTDMQQGKE